MKKEKNRVPIITFIPEKIIKENLKRFEEGKTLTLPLGVLKKDSRFWEFLKEKTEKQDHIIYNRALVKLSHMKKEDYKRHYYKDRGNFRNRVLRKLKEKYPKEFDSIYERIKKEVEK